MNNNENPNSISRSIIITIEKILDRCEKLETKEEKIRYLKKVITDCQRIINLAETIDGKFLDITFVKKTEQNIDENLIWFLEKGGELNQGETSNFVREEKRYYLVSRAGSNIVRDIQCVIEGMSNIKEVLEDDVAVIETTESKEEKATLGTGNRIKAISGMTDIVRIFESMKDGGIIWSNTPVKDIAEIFFREPADKFLFEKRYNSIKSQLKKDGSSSNSEALVKFVIDLCKKSFHDKEYALEEIIKSLEEIQKT
jgi:hypothetical protein